jgi:hypothetical protein
LDAATFCLTDSLFGACDNRRSCKVLKLDNILEIELSFGVVIDPASWYVWYLEFVAWTSSLKHCYEDRALVAVSDSRRMVGLTWIVHGINPGSWRRGLPVHHTDIVHLVKDDIQEAANGYAKAT